MEKSINSIQPLPLTAQRLDSHGVFLINDGLQFIIWLGSAVPPEFVAQLLGMEAAKTADLSNVRFNFPNQKSKYRMLRKIFE